MSPSGECVEFKTSLLLPHMDASQRTELEAAAFRRLLRHLQSQPDVQNIDLMLTADFCRNCLSKWLVAEALDKGLTLTPETAAEWVYGMPQSIWKARYQKDASPEKLEAFKRRQAAQAQQ